jgi:hypothetical protein
MRIQLPDSSQLDALHDFLTRCEWVVDRRDGDLVPRSHPTVEAAAFAPQLALFLGVWSAMHPESPRPRLVPDEAPPAPPA